MKRLNSNLSNFDYLFMFISCMYVFPFQYHPYPMSYPVLAHGCVQERVKDRVLFSHFYRYTVTVLSCRYSVLSFELCHCFIFNEH